MPDLTPQIKKVLAEKGGKVLFAYLFGSQARKDARYPARDVDIALFVTGDADTREVRLDLYGAFSRSLGMDDIDIVVLNDTHNLMLLEEVIRQGIVLLDRDPDLREAFEVGVLHQAIDFRTQRVALMGM